jgi:hypothetical protein
MTPLTTKNNNCTKWLDRDINTTQTTYTSEAVYILMEVPRGQEVPLIIIRDTPTLECTVVTSTKISTAYTKFWYLPCYSFGTFSKTIKDHGNKEAP